MRTVTPAASTELPAGSPVMIAATLVGRGADLTAASLTVDGADVGAGIDRGNPRTWTISTSATLAAGTHTARVSVTDSLGGRGGFTWQFTVGEAAPEPEPSPSAVPAGPTPAEAPATAGPGPPAG